MYLKMGGERQTPKGTGYVGGFLQLFDWNTKSRKKLFSSKSDIPVHSKQEKRGDGNFPGTRIHMVEEDEIGILSTKRNSDDFCAPGVVGRLMGLDSLPTSNATDTYSSPFFDTQSLNEFQFRRNDLHFYQEHQILNSGKFFNEAESLPKHHQKSLRRPLEKFQKENLPSKSAKSIPITQNRLLSPIKKPGFVASNDVAHIMEAAARIIEPRPRNHVRTKISSAGSSSSPLKVRELEGKTVVSKKLPGFVEASQKELESNAAKKLKAESSASIKNTGKSINLAIQAKVNVQKREGLNSSQNIIMDETKENHASGLSQSSKNVAHKKPSARNSSSSSSSSSMVLRQNNQKQNCNLGKENVPSKSSAKNGRKIVSGDLSHVRQKNKYRDSESSRSRARKSRNVPKKKRSIDGKLQDLKTVCDEETNSNFLLAQENRKKGAEIVSFTFSSPMARSGSIELPKNLAEERNNIFAENNNINKKLMLCQENMKSSSQGYDVVSDSLSDLLDQKLREFTIGIDLQGEELDECSSTKVEPRKLQTDRQLDSSDHTKSCNSSSYEVSSDWEIDYIKDILSNIELMFKDCASGRTRDIINPHLFDQLEKKRGSSITYKEAPLSEKKALFESVRECLDSRCQRYINGGFNSLQKGLALVRRKEKLAEEVYKEIQGWRRVGNCMLDDELQLVDKDMSSEHGKWLEFDADGFEIGVDVEAQIFDGLVDEVVEEILAVSRCNDYAGFC